MDRPPAYPDKAALARELCCSESHIDELVRRGILPKAIRLSSGCVRWCWDDVTAALASLKGGGADDLYIAGNMRAEAEEGPHGQTTKGKKRN